MFLPDQVLLVGRLPCGGFCGDDAEGGYIQPGTTMTSQAMAGPPATTMPL